MKNQKGFTVVELALVLVWMAALGGWVANIVKLSESSLDPLTMMVVLRAIGIIVAPLGAVLGLL